MSKMRRRKLLEIGDVVYVPIGTYRPRAVVKGIIVSTKNGKATVQVMEQPLLEGTTEIPISELRRVEEVYE